ncbi:exoglucanase 1 protein [Colletotrichum incanum]|uniref:Glucanase n=1 Tax=Colletotrichum incanum TaxID=1573173 RepID=A0A161Y7R5_COLIC|nr:exoglucanase 1 protein [Colletotrichum incanum]OHW96823.1 exoglucanase 1 [Colletotrichum incanum]
MRCLLVPGLLALLVEAQKAGNIIRQVHPNLSWKKCSNDTTGAATCETVNSKVVIDAGWRWTHRTNSFLNCYTGNNWDREYCSTNDVCTAGCLIEGTDPASLKETFGITTDGSKLSQQVLTSHASGTTRNSRVFLLEEGTERYQTFTLMGNEFAFDVELSSVECSINSALYFVAMDPDGGKGKYPTNEAGANYGTGYCDASCTRTNRFVGGKTNAEGWQPLDQTRGEGNFGACCSEFDVWNSNANSFSMISKPCIHIDYNVCRGWDCDNAYGAGPVLCDRTGCDYNPYRLGNKSFYGKGKTVDTDKKITVVTRFEEDQVTQFFIQDGKRIEAPKPTYPNFPEKSGISSKHCSVLAHTFDEPDNFSRVGGYDHHNDALRRPMVLAMSISDDYWTRNLWLDSVYPVDRVGPGVERGDCPGPFDQPTLPIEPTHNSKVAWSNIRFGPIGTTV